MIDFITLFMRSPCFGHQSVGYNILDGIEAIEREASKPQLKIVKIDTPADISDQPGILYHREIGSNFNPISKIDDFAQLLDAGIGGKVDVAFMKFCFVDIGTTTDIDALFSYYRDTMKKLQEKYPETLIVHLTVPLVSEKTGVSKFVHKAKGIVKKILGKYEFYENEQKFKFNEMMRAEYKGREPLFDLALAESTLPDGHRCIFPSSGKNIESLVPAYTDDGGHLNTEGRKIIAEGLLSFLAGL